MSFLQTKEWMDFQKSLGRDVFSYDDNGIQCRLVKNDLPMGKSYLYAPYGPSIDFNKMSGSISNTVNSFTSWLRSTARKNDSIFVKVEPQMDRVSEVLTAAGFEKSKKDVQPHKTVVVDLEKAHDQLLGAMHHKTRYNIKVAQRHEIKVEEVKTIQEFLALLEKTSERDQFKTYPAEYYEQLFKTFKGNGEMPIRLWGAKKNEKIVAIAMVLTYERVGYYLHGASDYESRSMMGPILLHWEIIKTLKAHGTKKYDLWGIDSKKWPGVTRFKFGWGGRVVEYPGPFDLTISKGWHLAYKASRKVLGK